MTISKQHDKLNRLKHITSVNALGGVLTSYGYVYDQANRRIKVYDHRRSFWSYEYDDLGQLAVGRRFWSDDYSPVAGQAYFYNYDDIGNRTSTSAGGNGQGYGLRHANYSANNLNQYSSRDNPGAIDISGIAHIEAAVTVNSQNAERQGEYFYKEVSINNASGPAYSNISIQGSSGGTNDSSSGNVLLPPATENFSYDADGNLEADGLWDYSWDGENRLVEIESANSVSSAAKRKLKFGYDYQGRRISKEVSQWTGSNWEVEYEEFFLYDGWNLIAIVNESGDLKRSFLWGLDLSLSEQGAGGVGGLLCMTDHESSNENYYFCYDGNGNVSGLVDSSDGSFAAGFEYGPFGEAIMVTGGVADSNPFRFSTKFYDQETDKYYYGYRYYDPSTGRWPNRDPIISVIDTLNNGVSEEVRSNVELHFSTLPNFQEPIEISEEGLISKNSRALEFVFNFNNPVCNYDLLGLLRNPKCRQVPSKKKCLIWGPVQTRPIFLG